MQDKGSLGKFMMGHGLVCVLGKTLWTTVEARLVPSPLIHTSAPRSSRQLRLKEVKQVGKVFTELLRGLDEIIVYKINLWTEKQFLNGPMEERMS